MMEVSYHLSAPGGLSINDFIDPFICSLTYCSIDDAYTIINKLEPGALLSKIDLKDGFCLIPVQPSDWNLLLILWKQILCRYMSTIRSEISTLLL